MVFVGGGGVSNGLNDSTVPTEQGIYDWIDTGTIWYKWWGMEGRRDRVKFRDAIASKKCQRTKELNSIESPNAQVIYADKSLSGTYL